MSVPLRVVLFCCVVFYFVLAILVYVGNMVLTCVFPMTNHLSMFSCANWLPVDLLLEKGLFLTTCPFFTWVICLCIIEL